MKFVRICFQYKVHFKNKVFLKNFEYVSSKSFKAPEGSDCAFYSLTWRWHVSKSHTNLFSWIELCVSAYHCKVFGSKIKSFFFITISSYLIGKQMAFICMFHWLLIKSKLIGTQQIIILVLSTTFNILKFIVSSWHLIWS